MSHAPLRAIEFDREALECARGAHGSERCLQAPGARVRRRQTEDQRLIFGPIRLQRREHERETDAEYKQRALPPVSRTLVALAAEPAAARCGLRHGRAECAGEAEPAACAGAATLVPGAGEAPALGAGAPLAAALGFALASISARRRGSSSRTRRTSDWIVASGRRDGGIMPRPLRIV